AVEEAGDVDGAAGRVGRRRHRHREDEVHRAELRGSADLRGVPGAVEGLVHRANDVVVRRALDHVRVDVVGAGDEIELRVGAAGGRTPSNLVAVQRRVAADGVPGELDSGRGGRDDVEPGRSRG